MKAEKDAEEARAKATKEKEEADEALKEKMKAEAA